MRESFALDPAARVKHLSKGQRARAGLVLALAHRPELLVLDEPSSGLDPIVRRDILGAVIRTVADEGRTVLFSSHLLDEVERVSDSVALLIRGRLAFYPDKVEIYEIDDARAVIDPERGDIDQIVQHTDAGGGRSQGEPWPPTTQGTSTTSAASSSGRLPRLATLSGMMARVSPWMARATATPILS